ncbi:MAG: metalloprotease [Gemmataceae bacterium]
MSLFLPEPTKYDLNFGLFGISVRVSIGFWAVHGLIAAIAIAVGSFVDGIYWILGAFVSIMVHELGHVLVGRFFGSRGEIILTPLGGLAGGASELHQRRHRILVYLAGPLAQLLLAGLLWLVIWLILTPALINQQVEEFVANPNNVGTYTYLHGILFYVTLLMAFNVSTAIFNLLPIPPLDGGKIMEELLGKRGLSNRAPWERDPNWWKRG